MSSNDENNTMNLLAKLIPIKCLTHTLLKISETCLTVIKVINYFLGILSQLG